MVISIPDALHQMAIVKFTYHIIARLSNTAFEITTINDMGGFEDESAVYVMRLSVFQCSSESSIAEIFASCCHY